MKVQIIYDSNHGRTKSVVDKFAYNSCCVKTTINISADIFLFFCPTYGDEELPHAMEDFLINLKIRNKLYSICELGNYYGYDDFEFGAKKIIEYHLNKLNWRKFHNGLSLDSMPIVDWETFNIWKMKIENALQNIGQQ